MSEENNGLPGASFAVTYRRMRRRCCDDVGAARYTVEWGRPIDVTRRAELDARYESLSPRDR